jgi:hypothetical protein
LIAQEDEAMFGWGINANIEGSKLVLNVPFHWLTTLFLIIPFLGILAANMPLTRRKLAWIVTPSLLVVGFLMNASSTTFDKDTNTVTIRKFWFGYRVTQFPLDTVDRMYVRTGDTVSQLSIQRTDGSVFELGLNDQDGFFGESKEQVAYEVNAFLGGSTVITK